METKIQEILKKAEAIVSDSGISEELRNTGFKEVFRLLITIDSDTKRSPAKTELVSVPTISSKSKGKTRSNAAKLVDELIKEGFFTEKRRDVDCVRQIDFSKGVKIPRNQMATILVRKLRSGVLRRDKTSSGYVYFVN